MSQPETLPQVLAWLAERWPERCRLNRYNNGGPVTMYEVRRGEYWYGINVNNGRMVGGDIATLEYALREIAQEAGWRWTLHQAIFEDRYTAAIHKLASEKTYRLLAWKDAPTPILALANAFREALES